MNNISYNHKNRQKQFGSLEDFLLIIKEGKTKGQETEEPYGCPLWAMTLVEMEERLPKCVPYSLATLLCPDKMTAAAFCDEVYAQAMRRVPTSMQDNAFVLRAEVLSILAEIEEGTDGAYLSVNQQPLGGWRSAIEDAMYPEGDD